MERRWLGHQIGGVFQGFDGKTVPGHSTSDVVGGQCLHQPVSLSPALGSCVIRRGRRDFCPLGSHESGLVASSRTCSGSVPFATSSSVVCSRTIAAQAVSSNGDPKLLEVDCCPFVGSLLWSLATDFCEGAIDCPHDVGDGDLACRSSKAVAAI